MNFFISLARRCHGISARGFAYFAAIQQGVSNLAAHTCLIGTDLKTNCLQIFKNFALLLELSEDSKRYQSPRANEKAIDITIK